MTDAPTARTSPALIRVGTVIAAGAAALLVWVVADPIGGITLVAQGAPGSPPMEIGAVPTLVVAIGSS